MPDHPVAPNPFSAPQANLNPAPIGSANVPTSLIGFVRTGQLISGALAMGLTIIVGVFVFLTLSRDPPRIDRDPVYLIIGGGVFAMSLMTAGLLTTLLRSQARDRLRTAVSGADPSADTSTTDADASPAIGELLNWQQHATLPPSLRRFAGDQQTAALVGQASMEGAGVINAVFYMMTGNWLLLGFVAVAIFGILSQMPTIAKLQSRIRAALDVYPS